MKDDNMAPKSLILMRNTEYQEFKCSDWAQQRMFSKPKSSLKIDVEYILQDQKQILRRSKEMAQSHLAQTFTSKKTMSMKIDLNASTSPFVKANYRPPSMITSDLETAAASVQVSRLQTLQRP